VIALKKILVPTDFSDASAAAVTYGVAFSRAFGSELHLLHAAVRQDLDVMVERQRVLDHFLAGVESDPAVPDSAAAQHAAREVMAPVLGDVGQDVRVECVLRAAGAGGPYVEIVRYASEQNIDLIVIGTHGRGFVSHALMGSVAEKVVRKAPCPVLTVHHPEHEFVLPESGLEAVDPER
jgi:nucleotide-binding universal stress UspA family protein